MEFEILGMEVRLCNMSGYRYGKVDNLLLRFWEEESEFLYTRI